MSKQEECKGCIGITDKHTCEGWDKFQRMNAEAMDVVPRSQLTAARVEIERLRFQRDELGRQLTEKCDELKELRTELSEATKRADAASESMNRPIIHICSSSRAEGSATVSGRKYRWEFHDYLGPTFLRSDGEPLAIQPGENHPVWDHFDGWLKEYRQG